eukprot:jgi/Orpsp1_1/1191360/evm.model.d7180000085163.1
MDRRILTEMNRGIVIRMDPNRIENEMHKFERLLGYTFNNIEFLSFAMRSVKITVRGEGMNHKEYSNEGLATIGDAILKFIIADYLFQSGFHTKG